MDYSILSKIESPGDVKKLTDAQVDTLCEEIRDLLISTVSENGGHLASNLGVVELSVALHRVFDSPNDSIIFDVGHQCYTHKLLTGRYDRFSTIRTEGGLSGFMRPDESEHDPFISGHSSTSISAALGLNEADRLNENDNYSIAIIGDGALSGGLATEGLANAVDLGKNCIVVLNDNNMSISKSVGGFTKHLTKLRSASAHLTFKSRIDNRLSRNKFGRKIVLFLKSVRMGEVHLLLHDMHRQPYHLHHLP